MRRRRAISKWQLATSNQPTPKIGFRDSEVWLAANCFCKNLEAARSFRRGIMERWLFSALLLLLAIAVMVVNKLTVCSWMRRKNPAATISIVGGWLGAVACGLSPSPLLTKLWWAPTVLDILGAPYLLILAWLGIREIISAEEAV